MVSNIISLDTALNLVEDRLANADEKTATVLNVLAAGLRWKAKFSKEIEDPAAVTEGLILTFPKMHFLLREIAAQMREKAKPTRMN